MQKGNIGVTTENIFPVIKKFLYSDHEIFLREMVSNAVDATQKLKTLKNKGDFAGEEGDLTVRVSLDEKAKTLTVSDRGIGMTAEEIDKYINQIAFSGVTDFLDKYKDQANAIIGHFGLGFYSAFMVSDKVEIVTRSWQDGAQAVRWTCDGSPEFTDEDNIINNVEPLWTKTPSTLKDEDYKAFYRTLYPMHDEPLFWIHLNVDYPFNLTGILYFPRVKSSIELQPGKIQLYCNQVFVTDQVEGIVPQFLTLLHGVIDSPDIPLNVSRSYLQSDANVKKISTYITKKVADRLKSIFTENRKEYEEKWDDLKLFIDYGMLTDESFYDRAKDFALMKDVDGKSFTYDEYRTLIEGSQKDKDGTLVYLYATDRDEQYAYIEAARQKGYSVLLMDGQLDTPVVSMLEQKLEKSRFTRVDGDVIDRLIPKDDAKKAELTAEETDNLSAVFSTQLPKMDKAEIHVEVQPLGETAQPVIITQSEYMRRMKDMSRYQTGMAFYGQMPDMYSLVLNSDHALLKRVLSDATEATAEQLKPITAELKGQEARLAAIRQTQDKKKYDELTQEDKDLKAEAEKAVEEQKQKRTDVIAAYAKQNDIVHQLIDLALLQNGLLKGEALSRFLRRSVELIEK